MGYRVLGRTQDIMKGYQPRPGLEGPFVYANGRILYYDNKEGAYYDPTCDWYVSDEEMSIINNRLMDILRG